MSETAEPRAEPTPGPYEIWGKDEPVPGVPSIEIGRGDVPSPGTRTICWVEPTLKGDSFWLTPEDWATARLLAASWDTAAERDGLKVANAALAEALGNAVGRCTTCGGRGTAYSPGQPPGSHAKTCPDCKNWRAVLKAHGPAPQGGDKEPIP